jgi:hypothetical protein
MPRPIPQEDEWKSEVPFQGEDGKKAIETLEKRVNQHVRFSLMLVHLSNRIEECPSYCQVLYKDST